MLVTVAVVVVLLVLFMIRSTRRPRNYPPGPPRLPLFGSFFSINPKLPSRTFFNWSKLYGDIYGVKIGVQEMVILNEPHIIKDSLSSADFNDRPDTFNFKYFNEYRNVGLVTSWGSMWKEHRRFSLRHLREFGLGRSGIEEIVKNEISEQLKRMREKTGGEAMELGCDFNIALTNIIWSISTGSPFDLEDPEIQELHRLTQELFTIQPKMALLDFFPFLLYILPQRTLGVDKGHTLINKFRAYFKKEIDSHRQTFKVDDSDRDLIDAYLRKFNEESGNPGFNLEDEEFNLMAIMTDIFIAGGETTFTTLRWAFTFLVKYPHIQKEIQKEINEVVGDYRMPTMDDKSRMPYLEAFIMEVQRYSNVATLGLPHAASQESTIRGYTIPKGAQVIPNLYACHMNPEFWGDPQVFRPERFLDEKRNLIKNDAWMPFSSGRRQCLGESLAKMELFLFIGCLLQQFTFTAVDDPEEISLEPETEGIVRHPKRYKMTITNRQKN